ncbi:MAG TPA: DNA mismatch repair protein MutS [Chitinophagaceae bacterium]
MFADKTTLTDLSIFHHEEELSVFHYLNHTRTVGGKEWLRQVLSHPFGDIASIKGAQSIIRSLLPYTGSWPVTITNGTIMVIEKFFDTPVEDMSIGSNRFNSFLYQVFYSADFALARFSVQHFVNFVKGMREMSAILGDTDAQQLQVWHQRIDMLLAKPVIREMLDHQAGKKLSAGQILRYGAFLRRQFKSEIFELVDIYCRLDAYYSMAVACDRYQLHFPEITESDDPYIEATGLFHLLLPTPVAYEVELGRPKNFLFLTGANMAGKSTFIKAVGVAVYLAHVGMAVPARQMQLSLFQGLLGNIQVMDNLVKGESYFFNEVQRIRSTIERISDGKNWLILIDELFKGTNVQDAMKCSMTVIEGLRKMHNALFILSTHLYEIGETLKQYDNIQFRYFETHVDKDQLVFSYQLKDGISSDRLGYLILKREGVVDLLQKL